MPPRKPPVPPKVEIYTRVAAAYYGIKPHQVTEDQKQQAKRCTYLHLKKGRGEEEAFELGLQAMQLLYGESK